MGLPFPPPGDLPDSGIEPASLMSPALAGRFFTTSTTWETLMCDILTQILPLPCDFAKSQSFPLPGNLNILQCCSWGFSVSTLERWLVNVEAWVSAAVLWTEPKLSSSYPSGEGWPLSQGKCLWKYPVPSLCPMGLCSASPTSHLLCSWVTLP